MKGTKKNEAWLTLKGPPQGEFSKLIIPLPSMISPNGRAS
jgi:hypothetical protein